MNKQNKNRLWKIIQKTGDLLLGNLNEHPNHPNGRNPYAHICLLINQKFSCSYKDISDEKVEQLKRFIMSINK